ncbi:hypothetical protein MTP99_005168 [Tenebrio molitor]|nr:hypothetical protein MTP99_005168 [Tenebrio molitor]
MTLLMRWGCSIHNRVNDHKKLEPRIDLGLAWAPPWGSVRYQIAHGGGSDNDTRKYFAKDKRIGSKTVRCGVPRPKQYHLESNLQLLPYHNLVTRHLGRINLSSQSIYPVMNLM